MPFFGGLVQNQVLVMQPPTLKARPPVCLVGCGIMGVCGQLCLTTTIELRTIKQMKAEYNTSRAVSNHFVRYMYKINHANDYSFALKADPDYANVYDAWWALIDINNQMFKETGRVRFGIQHGRRPPSLPHLTPPHNSTVPHEPVRRHPLALRLGVPHLRRLRQARRALRPHRGLLRARHRCVFANAPRSCRISRLGPDGFT